MRIASRAVAPMVLLATLAAGCGGGGANATPTPSSSMSDADLLTLGKQIVQCMRDNGIADMPDPYVEKGELKLPEDQQEALEKEYTDEQRDAAEQACQDLLDRVPQGAVEKGEKGAPSVGPGDVEALKKFAACVRQNGVPDFPDPNSDGTFTGLHDFMGSQPDDNPTMQAALKACDQYWSGGLRGTE